ncbi:MAG: calcium:proton antiporter [Microbacteriaceae bacterium]
MNSTQLRQNLGAIGVPILGVVLLAAGWNVKEPALWLVILMAVVLAATVLAAVHHAEVIAHKVGEPYGSLVLAIAVTVIEVALIITLVVSGGPETATLARDTVFAAAMITVNGILGVSLLVGALRHGLIRFNAEGAGALLATVTTLAVLCLVVPTFTSAPAAQFSTSQLIFVAVVSLALYALFVTTQTLKHRDFFLPVTADGTKIRDEEHAAAPTTRATLLSLGMLMLALVAVVGLAKLVSPSIEAGVVAVGFPNSFVGVVIALLVLLPESIAAVRAARRNRIQTSINLALGSAMASIGLTIPAIAVASFFLDGPLLLGLGPTQIVLLLLTVVVSILTIAPGRATRLQGGVHLAVFAAFIFLSIAP